MFTICFIMFYHNITDVNAYLENPRFNWQKQLQWWNSDRFLEYKNLKIHMQKSIVFLFTNNIKNGNKTMGKYPTWNNLKSDRIPLNKL